MFNKTFDVRPEPRMAFKLTLVLWLAILSFVAPSTILLGQVEKVGDYVGLFSGTVTGLALALVLYWSFKLLAGRPLWLGYVGVAFAVILTACLPTAADYAAQHVAAFFFEGNLPSHQPRFVIAVMVVYFALYVCNATLFWTSFTQQQVREQEVRAVRAELRATQSELARLRLQLDPHFMCNALNAIAALVDTGQPQAASRVAERLASFLRSAIESNDQDETRLGDELETVLAYIHVEEARFGDRLSVELACPDELHSALLPGFILQPLVENALKHGAAPDGVLTVRIAIERIGERLELRVENSRSASIPALASERGVGLRNIRSRLDLTYGDEAELAVEAMGPIFRAVIRLPYRT